MAYSVPTNIVVETGPAPVIKRCDVGVSKSGYVMLRINETVMFALPPDLAEVLAKEITEQAALLARKVPLS